jgi:geranylgeranyl pyrophosphate synthase
MITIKEFEEYLQATLVKKLPHNELKDVILYSALPAGKMIRAQIIFAVGDDLQIEPLKLLQFAAFIELHHTYTLIHDDLPAMDNDDIRRGRASSHKKYNEWKAILAGDALMNLSFDYLNEIKNFELMKLALWCTGAKGLIGGQFLDLEQKNENFNAIKRLHELKTARLFVLCFLGTLYLKNTKNSISEFKNFFRLGQQWGLLFQLLDDLDDLENQKFHTQIKNEISELNNKINFRNLIKTQKLFEKYKTNY